MPKVTFLMDDISVEVAVDEKLVDIARNAGSSIPFGCTNGICGTCISKVTLGKEHLNQPDVREAQTLEMFGADSGEHRLACQCVVKGDVTLDNP